MKDRSELGTGITTEQQAYDGNSLWANHYDACRRARACSDGYYPVEEFRTWVNSQFSIVKHSQEIPNENEERAAVGALVLDYAGWGLHQYVGKEVKQDDGSFQLMLTGGFLERQADVSFAYTKTGDLTNFAATFYDRGRDEGDLKITRIGMKMDDAKTPRVEYSTEEQTRDDRLAFNKSLFLKVEDIFEESDRALSLGDKDFSSMAHTNYAHWLESQAQAFADLLVGDGLRYDKKLKAYYDKSSTGDIDQQRGENGFTYDRKSVTYRKDSFGQVYELKFSGRGRKHLHELKITRKASRALRERIGQVELAFVFSPGNERRLSEVHATDNREIIHGYGVDNQDKELNVTLIDSRILALRDGTNYKRAFITERIRLPAA